MLVVCKQLRFASLIKLYYLHDCVNTKHLENIYFSNAAGLNPKKIALFEKVKKLLKFYKTLCFESECSLSMKFTSSLFPIPMLFRSVPGN